MFTTTPKAEFKLCFTQSVSRILSKMVETDSSVKTCEDKGDFEVCQRSHIVDAFQVNRSQ